MVVLVVPLMDVCVPEKQSKSAGIEAPWWQALRKRDVLLLATAYLAANIGGYGFILWLPNTLSNMLALSTGVSTALSALPFVAAVFTAVIISRSADRYGNPKLHASLTLLAAGAGLVVAATPGQPAAIAFAGLTMTGAAMYSYVAPFWVIPTLLLGESAAAASIGMINSIGNLGGFVGPAMVGYLLSLKFSYASVLSLLAGSYALSATLTALVRIRNVRPKGEDENRA